jgi:hypothetical protein
MTMREVYDALVALQQVRDESRDPDHHWREREAAMEHFDATFDFLVAEVRDTLQSEAN